MKTAISLPDDVFASTDTLARRMGLSRSALITRALTEFIAKHRSARVTERLDAVYSVESDQLDPALARSQREALRKSAW